MQPPENMTKIVNRLRYSTATALLLAGDDFHDGHNFERHGRQTFLYRTPGGRYFQVVLTAWQGELDQLIPLSQDEAIELYENDLPEHRVEYDVAFPGVTVKDA